MISLNDSSESSDKTDFENNYKKYCNRPTQLARDFRGRLRVVNTSKSNPFYISCFSSAGDNITTEEIGGGNILTFYLTTQESVEKTIEFIEDCQFHKAIILFENGSIDTGIGDYGEMRIYAKATETSSGSELDYKMKNPGGGDYRIIKDEGNGDLDLDGMCVPVQARDIKNQCNDGYWNKIGAGSTIDNFEYRPNADGEYNFFNTTVGSELHMANFGYKISFLGNGIIEFNNEDPFEYKKGHIIKIKIFNSNTSRSEALKISMIMKLNRITTK